MSQIETAALAIHSYHAHVYWRTAAERELAMQLREHAAQHFQVQVGRVHDAPVGPHTQAMFQLAFSREWLEPLVSWLMLRSKPLSVLLHPNTGRDLDDHLLHALWFGERLPIREEVLSNG